MNVQPLSNVSPNSNPTSAIQLLVGKGWRTTIPKKLRDALDIHEDSILEISLKENQVIKMERLPTLEEMAGSLELLHSGESIEEAIQDAKHQYKSNRLARKLHHG